MSGDTHNRFHARQPTCERHGTPVQAKRLVGDDKGPKYSHHAVRSPTDQLPDLYENLTLPIVALTTPGSAFPGIPRSVLKVTFAFHAINGKRSNQFPHGANTGGTVKEHEYCGNWKLPEKAH